jgi:glycerol-3-phosphate dehydrogenase
LSVFAGIRPLVNQREIDKTSSISRGHDLFVDDSGLITITGGKWTTYRTMGEDAVDTAIKAAERERRECITYDLPIEASKSVAGERLHPDLPYTRDDVIRAVREEMAVALEDVLARRTRALFLNAKAALEVAPVVAQGMSEEMETDGEWAASQVEEFRLVADAYTGKG